MQKYIAVLLVCYSSCASPGVYADDSHSSSKLSEKAKLAIELNNEAIDAMNAKDWSLAINKLKSARQIYPSYEIARSNLATAHNNYGLTLMKDPAEALPHFHQAFFLRTDGLKSKTDLSEKTSADINIIVKKLGKDPRKSVDRVQLGDEARSRGDFVSAAVEYSAALDIEDTKKTREKLEDTLSSLDRQSKSN
jgi:tetratricopeptide (TPR) repeat protein